jgi:hypothetical protein
MHFYFLVLLIVTLGPLSASAGQEIPELVSSETLHVLRRDNPTRARHFPCSNHQTTLLKELRSQGSELYRLYYPVIADQPTTLMAIEKLDPVTQSPVEFKHPMLLNGRKSWTHWMPSHLAQQGHLPWIEKPLSRMQRECHTLPISAEPKVHLLSQSTSTLLEAEMEQFSLFAIPRQLESTPTFNWEPGNYSWEFDPHQFKMWAGYLWEFKDGRIFKGYRKHRDRNENLPLTPSEHLTASDEKSILGYYSKLNLLKAPAHVSETQALSPLDKFGLWAAQDHGLDWWLPSSWEASHHYTQYPWGGYCNASAVLPFLWDRPTQKVIDHGLQFDPRDLVGIMQAASYDVDFLFWGNRYHGQPGNDIADPNPELVVNLLREYLGKNHIPLVYDWDASAGVGNLVALRSHLKIEPTQNPLKHHATLQIDSVGNLGDEELSVQEDEEAKVRAWNGSTMTKVYEFQIVFNPDGTFHSAYWTDIKSHPDFLWLPIGFKDFGTPDEQNPHIKAQDVQRLVRLSTPDSRATPVP